MLQTTFVALASPMFLTFTVKPFPPDILIINAGFGVTDGMCFHIPPVVESVLKAPS